jgi:hypothetical protein
MAQRFLFRLQKSYVVIARSFPRWLLTFASIKRGETNGSLGTDLVAFIRVGVEQNVLTCRQSSLDSLFHIGLIFVPTEPLARYGPLKPSAESHFANLHCAQERGSNSPFLH